MTKHGLTITFPSREMRSAFKSWMSDGGGESDAIESFDIHCNVPEDQFVSFDYPSTSIIHCTLTEIVF